MGRRSRSREHRRRSRSRRRRSPSFDSSESDGYERRSRRRNKPDSSHNSSNVNGGGEGGSAAGHHSSHKRRGGPRPAYTIPDSAPRMEVPSKLPVEMSSFVDLFSLFVSRGGPTLEEEIKYRERNNPFFAFLRAPWNDPINVYYRWRLFSLLQEGQRQFMRWSTEPYQLEQGKDAVVWIPPPQIQDGIEHFSYLCDAVLLKPEHKSLSIDQLLHDHQKPAALWLSRLVTNDETFFVALRSSEISQWVSMLNLRELWTTTACTVNKSDAADAPPTSSDNQQGSDAQLSWSQYMAALDRFQALVLKGEFVAERMSFAIEHRSAGVHVLSFVMDELLRHALAAIALCEVEERLKEQGPLIVVRHLVSLLSLLFVLHDICRNAIADALTDAEVERLVDLEEEQSAKKATMDPNVSLTTKLGGSTSLSFELPALPNNRGAQQPRQNMSAMKHKNPIIKGLEWMMPSIIEAVVRVAVSACGAKRTTGDGQSTDNDDRASAAACGVEVAVEAPATDGILSDHDPQPTVHVTLSNMPTHAPRSGSSTNDLSTEEAMFRRGRGEMRIVAMQLLSWTRSLIIEWGDSGLVGSRCWLKLQSTYGFLICHPIEDVAG